MTTGRRKFLMQASALAGGGLMAYRLPPVERLVSMVLREGMRQAHADQETVDSRYVGIFLLGAPPRWMFDQVFKTNADESTPVSRMVATHFVNEGGAYRNSTYGSTPIGNVLMPYLWSTNVAAASGGVRPLRELAENMIVFRGYGTGVDGHPSNAARQTNPVPGAGSLGGHMADLSATLLRAAQFPVFNANSGYNSLKGTGLNAFNYYGPTNYATVVMSPFQARGDTAQLASTRGRYAAAIERASAVLRNLTAVEHADGRGLATDHASAMSKIKVGIGNMDATWGPIYTKYYNLARAMFLDRSTPGFNDLPVVTPDIDQADDGWKNGPWNIQLDNGMTVVPQPGQDMRDWVTSVDVSGMASEFAFAEFLAVNDLAGTSEIFINQPGAIRTTYVQEVGKPYSGEVRNHVGGLNFDQHIMGVNPGLFLNSCFYRAFGACLLEFNSVLKATNRFNKTVVHVTQEFGRSPRQDASGSDHHFDAMISSVYTGQHTGGPLVLGNILGSGTNGALPPHVSLCSGYKAPTKVNGSSVLLTPSHVTSSIATLLKFPTNPWANVAESMVEVQGGAVKSRAEGKVVAS